ncbi:MAG: hypothetical protein WAZ50_02020 [Minisyncoccia bacterium]
METVRDLILTAGKKWRVFASGETPTAGEMADGLSAFQDLVNGLCVGWTDVDKTAAYEAKEDERVKTTGAVATVTLPDLVDDYGGQRRPRSGAKVLAIGSDGTRLSMYRGDKGAWITASDLTLEADIPLDSQIHNLAADALAGRYCSLFGEPTQTQYRASQRALGLLSLATRPTSRETY